MTEATTEEKASENKTPTKHKLPEGVMTPVEATNRLKKEGHAPAKFSSQAMYTLTKSAPGNKMPVKHYDADGTAFDERQVNEHGLVTTRPGLTWDELLEWWKDRPTRGSSTAKAETDGEAKAEVSAAPDIAADEEDELGDDELEEAE